MTVQAGGTDLRVIHQRSADPGAPVVVLLHGWPDSVLRFESVLPLLADPHVVVPALPGFPFAAPLTVPGMSANRIAGIVADARTIGTSFAAYVEPVALPDRIDTPTALSVFPRDIKPEPRSYAEAFLNVRGYAEHRAGGHFAAWEQPEAYAGDVRRAVKLGG